MNDQLRRDLLARAAAASGWPVLHVRTDSEAAANDAQGIAAEVLGPIPQADLIEPADADDPEGWEVRVELPGADPDRLADVHLALQESGYDAEIRPGRRPGMREALDRGALVATRVEGEGFTAEILSDPERYGISLDLARVDPGPDPVIQAIEADLRDMFSEIGLKLSSPRGEGTVQPVVHRTSGRFGVRVSTLPGDGVAAGDAAQIGAIGRLVASRAATPVPLAPDVLGDLCEPGARNSQAFTVWIVGPAASGIPGDAPISGEDEDPEALDGRIAHLDDLADHLEIQVVPVVPGEHERVAFAVAAAADAGALPGSLMPGAARWVRVGAGWAFVPCWRLAPAPCAALAEAIRALPGVAAVRIVPGEPTGLGERWETGDPSWHTGSRRWIFRFRDGITDRDRLPAIFPRPATDADHRIDAALREAIQANPLAAQVLRGGMRPVSDGAGRAGLDLPLHPPSSMREGMLRAAFDALGAFEDPGLASLATWGWRDEGPAAQLWRKAGGEPAGVRGWV